MQKKDICVVVEDYPPVIVKGAEAPMVDDDWIVILGEEGAYMQFNLSKVLYFGVSNHDEDEEDDLHATY